MEDEPQLVVKVALSVDGQQPQELLHDLRADTSLAEHVAYLHAAFQLHGRHDDVALFVPSHVRFLSDDEWSSGLAIERLYAFEGCTLHLKTSPRRRVIVSGAHRQIACMP